MSSPTLTGCRFMIVVLIIGILVDIIFGAVERRLRRNRGLVA
ncbi:MAG: hypothetical protein ABR609_05255 [Acidimicrobiia bacterium]